MARRSPFNYDVSVAADKLRRTRPRGMSGAFETSERICDNPGCDKPAHYRAPAAPDRLNEFRWFCLEHVRDYNASWNFFANRSDDEVDRILRGATTWERPTWTLGQGMREGGSTAHEPGRAWARFGISDPMDVLGADGLLQAPGADPSTYELDELQRIFLFARADTIYGGSDEVQKNILAERVLGLPREPKGA